MSNDLAGMYQEVIIGHGHLPLNYRTLENATLTAGGVNPLHGTEPTVYLELTDGRINDVAFRGSRGAISLTSLSRMTTVLTEQGEEEALARFGDGHAVLTEGSDGEVGLARLGSLLALSRMSEFPSGSSGSRSEGPHFGATSSPTAPRGQGSSRR